MNFQQAIASGFRNYATFSGRACRSEYWYWVLLAVIGGIATGVIDRALFSESEVSPLNSLFNLALFLPSLAVGIRRLHDIDRTGWWWLIALTVVGLILLVIWACVKGTAGPNRFGPDPLAGGG
jgi:uncharacterized membrane protein YhaH (DUF805 family)